MDTFVKLALEKIVKASTKKDEELRVTAARVTELIASKSAAGTSSDVGDGNADKYFRPFQLACENVNPKIKATALDCIQKLIAYGYLRGTSRVLQNQRRRYLIDIVIETICSCRDDPGENVQLQVIKALLTAVSSNTCEVHGESLLLAVRACYHIYLVSRNQVNRTTAKATLTQMLNIVFQRMEVFDQRLGIEAPAAATPTDSTVSNMPTPAPLLEEADPVVAASGGAPAAEPAPAAESSAVAPSEDAAETPASSPPPDISVETSSDASGPASTAAAVDLSDAGDGEGYGGTPSSSGFRSPIHRDAFLLFRALCKLSMKGDEDREEISSPVSDTIALQSKVLSLELLLSVLEHSGPSFKSGSRFIDVIRQVLCESLLKNYVSTSGQVVSLSLKIFLALIRNFRIYLQREIEVFIADVFLRLLQSSHISFDQRVSVLHVFRSLCQDPWGMLELFINYDMATDRADVFQKVLSILASIARGSGMPADPAGRAPHESAALKLLALQGIVTLTRSLSIIVDQSYVSPLTALSVTPSTADVDAEPAQPAEDVPEDMSVTGQAAAGAPASTLVEDYDYRKRMKEEVKRAAIKFKSKPRDGIAHLVKIGKCQDTPESIAAAFHELAEVFDKTMMGDYMGGEKEMNIKVMHAYIDQMDFTGMAFAQGIKHFLAGFRLPGEAQKIDRMMEKFAERYCTNNPDTFPNADTAFVLAYAVIMLNTDAHNPNVKPEKKMTKNGFISNNRGIAAGQDVDRQLLCDIYDEIVAHPITLKEDDKLRELKQGEKEKPTEKRKKEMQYKERAEIVALGKDLFKSRAPVDVLSPDEDSVKAYYSVSQLAPADLLQYTRPMFEVVWGPLIAVMAMAMETTDDAATVEICLEGFKLGIHVAGILGMATERDSMVAALCNFTALDPISGSHTPSIMHAFNLKNIESTKAVLHIVLTEGNHIGSSWGPLLHCISQIVRYQLSASGLKTDEVFFASTRAGQRPRNVANDTVERANAVAIASMVSESTIERIFSRSVSLSSEAIVDFVTQLCRVSEQELMSGGTSAGQARVFCLQKLVEVADFNMDSRPRVVWANVWDILAKFFAKVGCHPNKSVAMFAIDSLKQLSLKFLEKAELKNFHFQTKFLWPFVAIVSTSPPPPPEIRELVIHVITNIVRARAHNIRSGWKSVLAVFSVIATDEDPTLISLAFDTLHTLVQQDQYFPMLAPFYVDAVHCLLSFASNAKDLVAIAAVDHIAELGSHLARGRVPLDDEAPTLPRSLWRPRRPSAGTIEAVSADEPFVYDLQFWYNLDGPENEDVHAAEQEALKYLRLGGSGALGDSASKLARLELRSSSGGSAEACGGIGGVLVEDEQGGWVRRFTECQAHFTHWWPLLTGLAALIGDDRLPVRSRALDVLFGLLRDFGPGFSATFWALVFRGVLLPLFDDVRHIQNPSPVAGGSGRHAAVARAAKSAATEGEAPAASDDTTAADVSESLMHSNKDFELRGIAASLSSMTPTGEEWLKTTCMSALSSLVRLQNRFFSRLSFLLSDLLKLLENCILQDIEGLARIGVACLQLLLSEAGPRFTPDIWDMIVGSVVRLFDASTPLELLACRRYFLDYQPFSDSEGSSDDELDASGSPSNRKLRVNVSGGGVNPAPGTPRRLYKTPYGNGIMTSVRPEDGMASVSLSWGAVLYCPAHLLGITDEQLVAMERDKVTPLQPSRMVAPAAASRRRHSSVDEHAEEAQKIVNRSLHQAPPGMDEEEYAKQIARARPTVAVPAPAPAPQPSAPARVPTLPFRSVKVVTECVVQLELVSIVNVLAESYLACLSNDNILAIITTLENSVEFARKFNADRRLREALWRAGFMRFARRNKLPLLLRQETAAAQQLLQLLQKLYHDESCAGMSRVAVDRKKLVVTKLMSTGQRMVERVSRLDTDIHSLETVRDDAAHKAAPPSDCEDPEREMLREIASYSPLLIQYIQGCIDFTDAQFIEHLAALYPLFVELLRCGSRDVRRVLHAIFQDRIPKLLPGSISGSMPAQSGATPK